MKIKLYLFWVCALFLPVSLFGQLTSFNAGPENGRYNVCEDETVRLRTFNAYFDIGPNPVEVDWMNSPLPESEKKLVRPTFTPPGPGSYEFSVRMSDLTFPEASFVISFKIVVVGKPLAKAGEDVDLCIGESIRLNAIETSNSVSVAWTHNGLGTLQGASTLAPTYFPAADETGTIKLVLRATGFSACGGESSDDLLLNYYLRPNADIAMQSPHTICSNEDIKINGAVSGSNSFKWHVIPGERKGNLKDQGTLSPTYIPNRDETGTVSIVLEAIGPGCSVFDTLSLNISNINIFPSHPGGEVLACNNENVTLFVTSSPGLSYNWSNGAKTNGIVVKAQSPSSNYWVEVTNTNGCKEIINFTITTKPSPEGDITTIPPPLLCSNQSIKLNATVSMSVSYKWHISPQSNKGTLTESNTLQPTYVPRKDEAGEVMIILETIGAECTVYDTLSLNISNMNIFPSHPGGEVLACNNENVNLFVTSSPELSYNWSNGAKTNGIVVKAQSPSSNYWVEVTNTNGCKEIINFTINTKPAPEGNITTIPSLLICSNQPVKLNATVSMSVSYKWHISPQSNKGTLTESNTLQPTYVPQKDENGIVNIILETIGAECTVYDTLKLNLSNIHSEISHPGGNVSACESDVVTLSVTASPDYTYLWNNGGRNSFISVKPPPGGTAYSVEITNKDGCKQTSNFNVIVFNRPVIQLNLNSENSILIVEPAGLANYKFFGKNKVLLYDGTSNMYDYSNISIYTDTIYVKAFSNDGCGSDIDGQYTNYIVLPKLKPVDAFTPNNDGINDLLMPGRRTMVIDRTSKVLYEGYDGWDGTYLGKEMPQGTYFYLLYDRDGNIYYKGPVTLLRNNDIF